MFRLNSPEELEELREKIKAERETDKPLITLCSGTACTASGSDEVAEAIRKEIKNQGAEDEIGFKRTGCHGFCEKGPIVVIKPETCYLQGSAEDAEDIVSATLEDEILESLLYVDPETGEKIAHESEIPFYKNQERIVFGPNQEIDPQNIEDYISIGGYEALAIALFEMTPDKVLEEVKKANLRGRGGGGFPAGIKWESTRDAEGEPKYVIVNCDEGDPGAYMDRSLMEGNPHSVLEGLTIGAYAIGAHEGFVYVRQEYPLAVKNLQTAIKQAKEYGLLGENILGSDFNFEVKIHKGAGAFVSGESSALTNALEGVVGEPEPKYVHTSEAGLWDKPTDLNNVETWANVPLIIKNGADWFTSIGTEENPGTKIFSLVGKVKNTGLVEVPMGTTLREIIFEIGGGIAEDKDFKAVQTGGPSGGLLPEKYLDIPVDFDKLTELGSMMGSGGMIVSDEDTCMVDVARYFVNFLCDESCGKCVPCREGLKQMRYLLEKITTGEGTEEDIDFLRGIARTMEDASLCALGQTAANPVLTTLEYFGEEYDAHIKEDRCPALVCRELISYFIDPDECTGCHLCGENCPANAVEGELREIHVIDQSKCTKCGTCFDVCRVGALQKLSGEEVPPPLPEEERELD